MTLSAEQVAQRLEGITATDVAAVVGVHPYRSPLDVFLEKTGQAAPFVPNDRSRWGDLLEVPIRQDYEERHGVRVEVPGTLHHPTHKFRMATPDGLVYVPGARLPDRGLEIKVHGRDAVRYGGLEYGSPGTDEVPPHELVQCTWGMHVTGLDRWDEVAFLDGSPVEYAIGRDPELIEMLVQGAEQFRVDHLLTGRPPPPDGSKAWDDWLKRRWSENKADLIEIDGDEAMMEAVAQLRAYRDQTVDLEYATDQLIQKIKLAVGDRAGLSWRDPDRKKTARITWKFSKESLKTAWKDVATDMKASAALVLSAKDNQIDELRRLVIPLGAAGDPLMEAIDGMVAALVDISSGAVEQARTVEVPGKRPFNVPRFWKTTKAAQAATEERNDD